MPFKQPTGSGKPRTLNAGFAKQQFKGAFFMRHPVCINILQRQRLVPGYRRHAGHHIQSAEHHSLPERGFNHQDEEFGWD